MTQHLKNNFAFYKGALLFILPICAQALVETIINLLNTFVVGQFGNDSVVAGVASSVNIYDMAWFTFFAIVATGNIFLAQYTGSENKMKIKETTNLKLFYVAITSIIFILILQFYSRQISDLILGAHGNAEGHQDAVNVAAQYNKMISWNYPLLGFAYIMSITMNASGNVRTPLLVSIGSLVLNTILVCTLSLPYAGGPNLGVEGLAISLIVSRGIECLIFIGYLVWKKPIYAPNLNIFKFSKTLHWNYIKAFVPMFLNQTLFGFSVIMQTVLFSYYGGISVVAAANIVGATMAIFYSTFRGYNALISYYVGQNLGRGELSLARENAKKILQLCLIISTGFAIIILSLAFWVPKVMFPNLSDYSLHLAVWYMAFNAITYFCINMLQPLFSFLFAGGYTLIVSIVDLILIWVCDIFIAFALLQWSGLSIEIIMMIVCLAKVIDLAAAYVLYRIVPWNKKIVDVDPKTLVKKVKIPGPIIEI